MLQVRESVHFFVDVEGPGVCFLLTPCCRQLVIVTTSTPSLCRQLVIVTTLTPSLCRQLVIVTTSTPSLLQAASNSHDVNSVPVAGS